MSRTAPLCVQCNLTMPWVNSVTMVTMFLDPPKPYQTFRADEHVCPNCGYSVLARFGESTYHHEEEEFASDMKRVIDLWQQHKEYRIDIEEFVFVNWETIDHMVKYGRGIDAVKYLVGTAEAWLNAYKERQGV